MFTPETLQDILSDRYNGITLTVILCDETLESHTFANTAIDLSTDTITVNNTFADGSRVQVSTTGTLSSNLVANEVLYVVNATSTTLQLSRTYGGSPINFTAQGTGTYSISELSISNPSVAGKNYPVRAIADIVRHEIANYQGLTNRPQVIGALATLGLDPVAPGAQPDVAQILLQPTCDNSAGVADVEFGLAAVIAGGSATPGNTTGDLEFIVPFGALVSVPAGLSITPQLKARLA